MDNDYHLPAWISANFSKTLPRNMNSDKTSLKGKEDIKAAFAPDDISLLIGSQKISLIFILSLCPSYGVP